MAPCVRYARGVTFLQDLRQATSSLHRQLDADLRLDSAVTKERYAAFLAGTLLVVDAVEHALPYGEGDPKRSTLLRADLKALGRAPHPAAADLLPSPANDGERIGVAYVVEGSALGGLFLAKAIGPQLLLGPTHGTSFLRLRGEATAAHWRGFLHRLDDFGQEASVTMRAAATRAAVTTFEAYTAAFRRTGALSA